MKKEKQVRSYKRRTKSGKIITVKAHTAKYEAADEKAKKSSKKEGAGKELEERKKKPVQLEIPFGKEEEKKVLDEVKETAKKESTKKPTEKKSYSMKEIRSAAKYVMKYSQPSMKSKADPEKLRRAQQIVEQEIPKDKNGKRNLSSYINSGSSDISTDNKPGTKRKVRPVGSGTVGPEPKKKKSTTSSTNDDQAVINFMESTYHVHYNPKTGKFDYALTGRQTKTRSVTMENARKSLREHQAYLSKLKSRDNLTPADKDSLSKARKGGYMPTKGKSLESGVSTTKKTTKTTPKSTTSEPAFTAAEFKEWYRGTGSAADKKVAKALRAQLGRSGYRKFEDEAIDNYSSRGHLSMFKRVT